MRRWLATAIVAAVAASGGTACRSHWKVETTQPVLAAAREPALSTSWPLTIEVRDMDLRYRVIGLPGTRAMRLANTAYYVVVSRDRLRFHVTLRQKFETMSDLRTWDFWVEDERGVRHEAEDIEQRSTLVGSGTLAFYVGRAAFTVYGRDLLTAGHRITLVLRRPRYEYRYVWNSADNPDPDERSPEPRGNLL